MPNSIAYTQNYTTIIDEVYQRASVSRVLNNGRRMVRVGRNAKEIAGSGLSCNPCNDGLLASG